MIETTFFSEVNKRIQAYGVISYFADDRKNTAKLITPQKRLKFRVRSKNYEENIALQLVNVESENVTIKRIENKISKFSILSENKNKRTGEKRQMSRVVDEMLISGLQYFNEYHKLNPIDIKINYNQIISSLSKYGKHCVKITSLLLGASFNQTTDVIFITCNELNDEKRTLINGKIHNILGVINPTEEANFDLIKKRSKWLNIIFKKVIEKQSTLVLR